MRSALTTPEKAERTSLPIAQCKQSTPNSMGRTTGDVLERLADLMTQRYARESLPLAEPETFKKETSLL